MPSLNEPTEGKNFFDRLQIEKRELSEKITRLEAFLNTEASKEILPEDRSLLEVQFVAMNCYDSVLSMRINRYIAMNT